MICPFGDPACPCPDGLSCHYKDDGDTKAMPPPTGWAAYLSAVSVSTLIPTRLGVEQRDGRECVFVELSVPCSRTGEPITVRTARPVQPLGMLTNAEAAATVRDIVRIAVLHEIDEAISIDGERVFDPHRGAS